MTVLVLLIVGLWIPQLPSSFRLDETATYWITNDGLTQTWKRSLEFQGETPLYFLAAWGLRSIVGSSELIFRLPSIIAMLLATVLLARLAARLFGRETALLAAIVFAAGPGMAFAAGDARPYPWSVAALVAATLTLARWVESSRIRDAIGFAVLAALAVYLHYFTAIVLIGHLLFAIVVSRRGARSRLAFAGAGAGILLLPTLPHLASLFDRVDTLAVGFDVSVLSLSQAVVPPVLALGLLFGLVVARMRGPLKLAEEPPNEHGLFFAIQWSLGLPVMLFLVSQLGSTTLFDPRFFFPAAPGLALLGGWAIRRVAAAGARSAIVATLTILSILAFATVTHSGDDWREASRAVNERASESTPVLVRTAFIESAQIEWLTLPDKRSYLLAPVSKYPMKGSLVLMPYALNANAEAYIDGVLERFAAADRLLYVSPSPDDIGLWLQGRLESAGFRARLAPAGSISILTFERAA